MAARVLTIKERHLQTPGALASLADFTYAEGDEVDPEVVVEDPDLSLYCLDDETRRAVFAQLPPGTDLTQVPFVWRTQGEGALRLVAVPYDDFVLQAAGLPKVETLVPIYIAGRSGSTLISHAFNESGAVASLSEPDVASQFAYLRGPNGSRDAEAARLLDATVRFLFRPNPHKKAATCALKFRSEGVQVMDLYQRTFPGARNLYSYREAVGFVASWYRLLKGWGAKEREPLSDWAGYLGGLYRKSLDDLKAYLGEGDEDVPVAKLMALWWLLSVEAYLTQHERGVRALAVRYDDLNTRREAVLREVFAYCGLPLSGVEKALSAFERDAQAGTDLARADPTRGNTVRLSDQQIADVHEVLQRHPVINTPDFVLPGTLEV